ncbi:hypothetical protein [Nocardioides solisilvae]|uniref:hypothetical protein n=1 Tax=Nocardioides solisilvae TaxID=1542435 RepID=UPI0013A5A8FC|nr:hypothetical protein [Nocardioides solisilvae]
MSPALSYAVAGFLGLVTVLALVALRLPGLDPVVRRFMVAAHGATAVVVLLDVVTLLRGHEVESPVTHIGYAVAAVGLPVILLNRRPLLDEDEGLERGEESGEESGDGAEPAESAEPDLPHLGVVAVTAAAMVVLVVRLQLTW